MNDQRDTMPAIAAKMTLWAMAWFGSFKLADVQIVVSIVSGLLVALLAALNFYVTWRDKIRRDRR